MCAIPAAVAGLVVALTSPSLGCTRPFVTSRPSSHQSYWYFLQLGSGNLAALISKWGILPGCISVVGVLDNWGEVNPRMFYQCRQWLWGARGREARWSLWPHESTNSCHSRLLFYQSLKRKKCLPRLFIGYWVNIINPGGPHRLGTLNNNRTKTLCFCYWEFQVNFALWWQRIKKKSNFFISTLSQHL